MAAPMCFASGFGLGPFHNALDKQYRMDAQADSVPDDCAKSDVVTFPSSDKSSGDALSIIMNMQTNLARQNDCILSQIKGISSDIGNMKRDIAKVTKIVSKLDAAKERETYAANTLQCEFRTFSGKVVSTLRSLQGNNDMSDCVDGYWNEYFHGEESVLSNFYLETLYANGLEFKSAEHMYQYRKAEFHGRERDVGEQILRAAYGAAAKGAASRSIEVCPQWEEEKEEIMFDILCLKAEQCAEFAEKLRATGSRPLIHDLPVYLWGWGINGQGLNLMGKILERVRAWMQVGRPSGITARHVRQQKPHKEDHNKSHDTQPQPGPLVREEQHKNTPASHEERKQKSPRKIKRSSDSDATEFSTDKVEDWPSLPQPGSKDSKRHVTSDDKSKSLQVEVKGDSHEQKQDYEGRDHHPQPQQRQGKGRGLLSDKYGSRRGGGNNKDSGRWSVKGSNYHYSEVHDKNTNASTHEQLNDRSKSLQDEVMAESQGQRQDREGSDHRPQTHQRQGKGRGLLAERYSKDHVSRRGNNNRDSGRWRGNRNKGHRYSEDEDRNADPSTKEQLHDTYDDPPTQGERHGHTGGTGRGSGTREHLLYEQPRSTESRGQEQLNESEQHDEARDQRHGEPCRGGRRGHGRGGGRNNQQGPRHQDSYSGDSRESRHHEYKGGDAQDHHYSGGGGGRRKAPYHDYAGRMYSDHQEDLGENSSHGRPESSNLPPDRGSHHTDLGMGVPPGFAKGQAPVGRPITNVKDAGADRHVTLGENQCQVTLECHPTKNSVSE